MLNMELYHDVFLAHKHTATLYFTLAVKSGRKIILAMHSRVEEIALYSNASVNRRLNCAHLGVVLLAIVLFNLLDVVPAGGRLVLAVHLHAELATKTGLVVCTYTCGFTHCTSNKQSNLKLHRKDYFAVMQALHCFPLTTYLMQAWMNHVDKETMRSMMRC